MRLARHSIAAQGTPDPEREAAAQEKHSWGEYNIE